MQEKETYFLFLYIWCELVALLLGLGAAKFVVHFGGKQI
jgi:hypothetical protein